MNYQPNILARGLVQKKTNIVGLITPDIVNPFFSKLAKGAEDIANRHRYNMLLCNTDGDPQKELAYMSVLKAKWIDGVILVAPRMNENQILSFVKQGISLVIADRPIEDLPVNQIWVDNVRGAYEATTHLIDLGHQKIGIITGPDNVENNFNRVKGYRLALKTHGIDFNPSCLIKGDFKFESGYKAMEKFLKMEDRPSAVFATNDLMALGALEKAKSSGLRVPEDLALVGFDDIMFSAFINPALTTVMQPIYELGEGAMKMLLQALNKEDQKDGVRVLTTKLIIRESCGAGRRIQLGRGKGGKIL